SAGVDTGAASRGTASPGSTLSGAGDSFSSRPNGSASVARARRGAGATRFGSRRVGGLDIAGSSTLESARNDHTKLSSERPLGPPWSRHLHAVTMVVCVHPVFFAVLTVTSEEDDHITRHP